MLAMYGLRSPQDVMPQAKAMALQALEVEPTPPKRTSHCRWSNLCTKLHQSDAEGHFVRALDLAPGYATGFQWCALNCLVTRGGFAEAHRAIDRAVALDPVSLPITTSTGLVWYFSGQFKEAAIAFSQSAWTRMQRSASRISSSARR